MPPFLVALTGGIASGKSTVATRFEALGIPVVDADQAARAVVAPGTAGLAAVVARFGPEYLTPGGGLDRPRLRQRIFSDPRARQELEAILHPLIRQRMQEGLAGLTGPYAILSVPLFVETGGQYPVDRVLVVDVPEGVQITRLRGRDGVDEAAAQSALAAQCTRAQRRAVADDLIDNTGDDVALAVQVLALHQRYLEYAHSKAR